MKKRTKIILIIIAIIIISSAVAMYLTYKSIFGTENIVGKIEIIPEAEKELPQLTKDSADWLNWRGTNLEGKSICKGVNNNFIMKPKILWRVDYLCHGTGTASWSAPVVQGNRLIITGRDEKNDLIFCINSQTGKLIWHSSYAANAEDGHGSGPRATPCIDENKVYTFGRSGDLACWQLEDGKLRWKKNVKDEGGEEPGWGFSSSPIIVEDKIFVQAGGSALIIAYNKNDGTVIWKSLSGNAGYAAIVPVVIENEKRLLAYHGKALSCLDLQTGKEYYNIPWETDYGVNATTPVYDNGILFHTSEYGMGGQALKLFKDKYQLLWKSKVIASHHSDPVLINGYLYGYSGQSTQNRGKFKCVELITGKEMWSTKEIGWGTTAYVDSLLICLDIKGNLHCIKPNPTRFEKVGSNAIISDIVSNHAWTVPVVANRKLYIRHMQCLICIDLMAS